MSANDPAFPCFSSETELHESGLTKREYFAAKAMQGMLANRSMYDSLPLNTIQPLAFDAVLVADALIKELQVQS
jgi:hypothetical protein